MANDYVFSPDYEGKTRNIPIDELIKVRTDEMQHIRKGFYTMVGEVKIYSPAYNFGTFNTEAPKKPKKKLMDILKGKKKEA